MISSCLIVGSFVESLPITGTNYAIRKKDEEVPPGPMTKAKMLEYLVKEKDMLKHLRNVREKIIFLISQVPQTKEGKSSKNYC